MSAGRSYWLDDLDQVLTVIVEVIGFDGIAGFHDLQSQEVGIGHRGISVFIDDFYFIQAVDGIPGAGGPEVPDFIAACIAGVYIDDRFGIEDAPGVSDLIDSVEPFSTPSYSKGNYIYLIS